MRFVGFAALGLMLAAMPVAAPAAVQPEAEAPEAKAPEIKADEKNDVEKPVTKAEISARLDTDYADMDADKDGKLTAV